MAPFPGLDAPAADRPDPPSFGRALPPGLGLNLLVRDMSAALAFQRDVLGAETLWAEPDFAVLRAVGAVWMLHTDRAYRDHPLGRATVTAEARGIGAELRLYGLDPDAATVRAEAAGATVLSPALDRPHGLREAHLVDPDGYVWVPSAPVTTNP